MKGWRHLASSFFVNSINSLTRIKLYSNMFINKQTKVMNVYIILLAGGG